MERQTERQKKWNTWQIDQNINRLTIKKWTNREMDKQTDRQMNEWASGQSERWTDGQIYKCKQRHKHIDRQRDG